MSKDDDTGNTDADGNARQAADLSAPFDRWLDRKLKTAYGSVLDEAIPQDIIDLLKKKLDRLPEQET